MTPPRQSFPRPAFTRPRLFLLLLAALVIASGGIGWTWRSLSSGEPAASLIREWRPGQRLVYWLEHVSAGALEQEDADAEPAWALLSGELVATITDVRGDEVRMTYAVRGASVRAEGGAELPPAGTLRDELSRDVFATLDRRGRVLAVRFDDTVSDAARQCLRAVLAAVQFVSPDAERWPDSWEAREESPDGTFLVGYAADLAAHTIVKTRVRHFPPPRRARPGPVLLAPVLRPEGQVRATLDPRAGHLLSLSGEEGLTVLLGGRTVARRYTSLMLELVRADTVPTAALDELRRSWAAREAARGEPLSWRESPAARREASYRQLLGDATAEDLLDQLKEAESSPNRVEENALDLKLRALAFLRPEDCPALGRELAAAPAKSVALPVLARALGGAGHPAAQQALAEAIRARGDDWPALFHLIPPLGSVEAPTLTAEEALRSLSGAADWNIRSTAQLALGAMARNLATTEPRRAASLIDWAVGELREAGTPAQRRQMLLVLGNAGAERALPAVRAVLVDAAPEVRAAAAHALRWVEAPEAEAVLLRALAEDAEAAVRAAAATALGFRPSSVAVVAAAGHALAADPAVSVRLAVLPLLWEAREDFPRAGRLVEQAAGDDPAGEVRQLAASLAAPAR